MFMPSSEDPMVAESAIVAFCVTLNTPVVNVEALDVGPARAGILLASGEYGELDLWVRVSLISSGEGVTFKYQGDPADFGDDRGAVDAALSFSEGMGFLFEDELVAHGGRSGQKRAHRIWTSLFEPPREKPVAVAPVLSRFQQAAATPGKTPAADPTPRPGGEELARIELASEEVGNEYVDHAGFLTRLLGSF